jgi:predicted transcriptional regulator
MKISKGRALMHRRKRLNVQQQELANFLGWTGSSLSKMENGRCESSDERFIEAHDALDWIEKDIPKA